MTRWDALARRTGKRLLRLSSAALLATSTGAHVQAQAMSHPGFAIPISPGDTVQVDAPPGVPTISRGRIVDLRPASMLFRGDTMLVERVVPFGDIKWLAVRRGSRGRTLAGLLVGLAAGAVISGAIYSGHNKNHPVNGSISEYTVIGAASGGVAGAIIGTTFRTDHWVPVIRGRGIEDFGQQEGERGSSVD
jgi:hypothetical protein